MFSKYEMNQRIPFFTYIKYFGNYEMKTKTKQKYWWHEWHLKIKTEHANKINYNYVLNNKNIS